MSTVDEAWATLDEHAVTTVRRALATLRVEQHDVRSLTPRRLASFVRDEIPRAWPDGDDKEHHEVVWTLGDFFAAADLAGLASVCRDPGTHRQLAASDRANRWFAELGRRRPGYFDSVVPLVVAVPRVPDGAALSLAPAAALLDAVGEGAALTRAGYLPPRLALAIDERFGWSAEQPWQRPRGERDLPRLLVVHRRLRECGLLTRCEGVVTVSAEGRRCATDTARLWTAVTTAETTGHPPFDVEVQALTCALLLMHDAMTPDEVDEGVASFLEPRWQGDALDPDRRVGRVQAEDVRRARADWYRLGLAFDWFLPRGSYDTRNRLTDVGRAAAAAWVRSVVTR